MGFERNARIARDPARPPADRIRALRRCVSSYAPYGYTATLAYLREWFGPLEDPARLVPALEALTASRKAWLAEVAVFADHRRAAKARGRRRPATAEVAPYRSTGWPGGGAATDRVVGPAFLRSYGIAVWEPAPVDHRRRLRRVRRVAWPFTLPATVLGVGLVLLPMLGLALRAVFDPPPIALWSFVLTALVALPVAVVSQAPPGSLRLRAVHARNRRVVAAAEAAERRLVLDRSKTFHL
ncbi:hypothetical protein [Dactylosporangium sp. NPDC000521]|uniref:hypothetical protein n=1 Tax=Dactylosporangium sp. NPDC000521 TaxID=3363975 RepID=UPI0036B9E211